ncbi:uncharacterized protein LOC103962020 isoform X3 [Pyrus x bretschneideri]|uniref:uncharacterized protein LOC103962020 isoform X3 n=1 Tax=Pyrus x bretschneideri TaxID=225117 RepID=UPI000510D232|nr:uncharacterized protein LOC103962020 isoform X3 [Pyrus x bretschneideri]
MGKIGGVQTLLNCPNLFSFAPILQRFFLFFYAGHESLCFFCCLVLLLVCFLCGSKTQNEEEGRDQAGVTSNSISSIWLLLCPLASRSLKTSVDSWLQRDQA